MFKKFLTNEIKKVYNVFSERLQNLFKKLCEQLHSVISQNNPHSINMVLWVDYMVTYSRDSLKVVLNTHFTANSN